MKTFQTTYDRQLLNDLAHLKNYPQLLPYIGSKWGESKKILFLAESHYLPGNEIKSSGTEINFQKNWYSLNENSFPKSLDYLKNYINTRSVIEKADDKSNAGFHKPLSIYYNIKNEIRINLKGLEKENLIFPFFSIYNYFQKPSFIETDSIKNTAQDDEIAFDTLKKVYKIINPELIVFVTKKGYEAFKKQQKIKSDNTFNNVIIKRTPHAGSAWWNKKAKAYNNKTGREYFIEIIKSL